MIVRGSCWRAGILALLAVGARASAHDARPLSVNLEEQDAGVYVAHVRVPPTLPLENRATLQWPQGCVVLSDDERYLESYGRQTLSARCAGGLAGKDLRIAYRIYNPALPTLFRLRAADGTVVSRLLSPDVLTWKVPKSAGVLQVIGGYLALGIRHIWTGIDHLLFVLGLMILARGWRRMLLAITGFTLAHSITLSLSALDLMVLPQPPVEAAIALSILFLAYEIARPQSQGLAGRYPVLVASSFGLLHGFGFAAALREAGLPTRELALGLFSFNCGVEIGQLTFIAAVLMLTFLTRRLSGERLPALAHRCRVSPAQLGGYGLGVPAAFWFIQRLALF